MKIIVLLIGIALATNCDATKSWNNDGYSDESFSVIGWVTYVKRFSLIVSMLLAVLLYYVPESRLYARQACYISIDIIAEVLKTAVRATETDHMPSEPRLKHERTGRHAELLSSSHKYFPRELYEGGIGYADYELARKRRINKMRLASDEDRSPRLGHVSKRHEDRKKRTKERRKSVKEEKHVHRQRRDFHQHQHRDASVHVTPQDSRIDLLCMPKRVLLKEPDPIHEYVKRKIRHLDQKDLGRPSVENYASYMISGSPRQMSMIDGHYERSNIVILKEPCSNHNFIERTLATHDLDVQDTTEDSSFLDQESPARIGNGHMIPASQTEASCGGVMRDSYNEDKHSYQGNPVHYEQTSPDGSKNWEKIESTPLLNESARNAPNQMYREVEQIGDNAYVNIYRSHGESEIPIKTCSYSKDQRVNCIEEPYDQDLRHNVKLSDADNYYVDYHCGEMQDEISHDSRDMFVRHDYDEKSQRESQRLTNHSDCFLDSSLTDDECEETPILKSRS